jgi:hypothetical protein
MNFCNLALLFKVRSFADGGLGAAELVHICNILLTASEKLSGIDDMNSETMGLLTLSYFENRDFVPLLGVRSFTVVVAGGRSGGFVEEFINMIFESNMYINYIIGKRILYKFR